jgi:hypothetical protein
LGVWAGFALKHRFRILPEAEFYAPHSAFAGFLTVIKISILAFCEIMVPSWRLDARLSHTRCHPMEGIRS